VGMRKIRWWRTRPHTIHIPSPAAGSP
jgi:hypothetical protein